MSYGVFNSAAFRTASGVAVAPLASIEVRRESDNALATLYSNAAGASLGNPFAADLLGRFSLFAAGIALGYKVTVTSGLEVVTLRNVPIGTAMYRDVEDFALPALAFSQTTTYPQGSAGLALQTVVNVKNAPYNAVGDGVANDRAAVQAALAYLITLGGGTLFFPAGTYLFSTPVYLDGASRICFRGVGSASKLKSPNQVYTFAMSPGGALTVNDCEFTQLCFSGTYGPSSPGYGTPAVEGQTGIYLNSSATVVSARNHVHHCFFDSMAGGVYATTSTDLNISDNFFSGCLFEVQIGSGGVSRFVCSRNIINKVAGTLCDDAIAIFGPSTDFLISDNVMDRKNTTASATIGKARIVLGGLAGTTMTRGIVSRNIILNNANSGHAGFTDAQRGSITVNADATGTMSDITIADNTIYNGMAGIVIYNSGTATVTGVKVIGNTIDTMQDSGISGVNGTNNSNFDIDSNVVRNCGDRGITHANVTRINFRGNTIRSCAGLSLAVDTCVGALVSGNSVTAGASDGIRINATPYLQIHNNVVENCGNGINFTGTCTNPNLSGNRYNGNTTNVTGLATPTTAVADATTPSVRNLDNQVLRFGANTVATALTQLADASAGQTVSLLGLSATNPVTLADAGNFRLTAAITLTANASLTLWTSDGTNWFERSRALN